MTPRLTGVAATITGSITIAAVSTLGDFIWATWIPSHRPAYGLTHGALLFLSIGLFLGALARQPAAGAVAGAVIGGLAAGTFYVLVPLAGDSSMFLVWTGVWVALAELKGRLGQGQIASREVMARGAVAAVTSGAAFYTISGIWRPFDPRGWDYAVHLGAWTAAYLPGFGALLLSRGRRSPHGGGSPRASRGGFVVAPAAGGTSAPFGCWAARLEFRRKSLRSVMDRENVNLIHTHEPVDDTVRSMNYLAHERVFEFRNRPTGFRRGGQPIGRSNQLGTTTTDA